MSIIEEKSITIHANCLSLGEKGILLIGSSGCGKSALTLSLIERAQWAKKSSILVSDDYTEIAKKNGKLYAKPPETLEGGIEIRGAGLYTMPFKKDVIIDFVVALGEDFERFPSGKIINYCNIELPLYNLPGLNIANAVTICQAIEALCFKIPWKKVTRLAKSC